MSFLSTMQQRFGFTRNEIKVILFLTAAFLAGLCIRWLRAKSDDASATSTTFDYSKSDREFEERSKKLALLSQARKSDSTSRQVQQRPPKASLQPHSININTATKEQLMMLPGIGEEYADRIMIYRDDNGPFTSVDDLVHVKGIGKKTLERLRPYIMLK
jgi:comEA protein